MKLKKISSHNDGLLKAIWEAAYDGMILVNDAGVIVSCNPAFCSIFGYEENELVNQSFDVLVPKSLRKEYRQLVAGLFHGGSSKVMSRPREVAGRKKNGRSVFLEIGLKKFMHKGEKLGLATLRNISAKKRIDKKLVHLAYYDHLTGLANRRYFKKQIQNRLLTAKRYSNAQAMLGVTSTSIRALPERRLHRALPQHIRSLLGVILHLRKYWHHFCHYYLPKCHPHPSVF